MKQEDCVCYAMECWDKTHGWRKVFCWVALVMVLPLSGLLLIWKYRHEIWGAAKQYILLVPYALAVLYAVYDVVRQLYYATLYFRGGS